MAGEYETINGIARAKVPTLTIEDGDVWTCTCGNVAYQDGFYPAVDNGTVAREVEPNVGGEWDANTMVCARCGAVYVLPLPADNPNTATIMGAYRVFAPLTCVCSYGLSGSHTINCLNYQNRALERAEARAAEMAAAR